MQCLSRVYSARTDGRAVYLPRGCKPLLCAGFLFLLARNTNNPCKDCGAERRLVPSLGRVAGPEMQSWHFTAFAAAGDCSAKGSTPQKLEIWSFWPHVAAFPQHILHQGSAVRRGRWWRRCLLLTCLDRNRLPMSRGCPGLPSARALGDAATAGSARSTCKETEAGQARPLA